MKTTASEFRRTKIKMAKKVRQWFAIDGHTELQQRRSLLHAVCRAAEIVRSQRQSRHIS